MYFLANAGWILFVLLYNWNLNVIRTSHMDIKVSISFQPNSEIYHTGLYLNMQNSASNLSIERGLSASPIPWRDASMEVLVSPNDGPQISFEDLDLDASPMENPNDSPFLDDLSYDSMSILSDRKSMNNNITRLKSDSSTLDCMDKLTDRRFACYGVSPRLPRKICDNNCTPLCTTTAAPRPTSLNYSLLMGNSEANQTEVETKPLSHKSKWCTIFLTQLHNPVIKECICKIVLFVKIHVFVFSNFRMKYEQRIEKSHLLPQTDSCKCTRSARCHPIINSP